MEKSCMRIMFGLVVVVALAVTVAGCGGGGKPAATQPAAISGAVQAAATKATTTTTAPSATDLLSTFKSKDPFIVPAAAVTVSENTTTTASSEATTTANPSEVTVYEHSLKVLSIDVANGTTVVTYQVDGVVYQDKQEGDVSSTKWGEIKVVSIDSESQTVVLLQGSETRTLQVGQEYSK
jgi:hypothetical protein